MRNRLFGLSAALAAALALPASSALVSADGRFLHRERGFSAKLESYNEVPTLSLPGSQGAFRARLNRDGDTLHYRLSYSGMSANVLMAHIHIGKSRLNGPIMVWLCQTATNVDPTGLSPTCPVTEGTVDGELTAANVLAAGTTGLTAGEFEEFLRALREDAGYVNVHTTAFPGGEIRGQVR
jgi:hypothetical protein